MATLTIRKLDTEIRHPLYHHYDGQFQPQPAYLEIDLESGVVEVDYSEVIGGGVGMRVWNNVVLRYPINPDLVTSELNELLDKIEPLADQIVAGSECRWDNSNWCGFLCTTEAEDANTKIERICDELYTQSGGVMPAVHFFQGSIDDLSASTTDEQIEELAESIEDDNDMTIPGIVKYLTSERDELMEDA